MKKIARLFIAILTVIITLIVCNLVWTSINAPLEIPILNSEKVEYGEILTSRDISTNYEVYYEQINSNTFIDDEVNNYINDLLENIKKSTSSLNKVKKNEKAVLKQVIDTYKVNDDIVSVKVTYIVKNVYEESYKTNIKTFNYNLKEQKNITLEDMFKPEYKEKLSNVYSNDYLLKENEIEFYEGSEKSIYEYSNLKEFLNNKILTAKNLNISDEEYDNLFSKKVEPSKKMVAITLDDGPHPVNTQKVLDILKEHNAKATFFMVGQNVENNSNVVKAVYNSGSEIGIHTWSHKQLTKISTDEIIQEVNKTSDVIFNITGERPKLVRPPYGSVNDNVKNALKEYPLILWNIDSLDWKSRDEKQIVPLVMEHVEDADIILLHDIHATTIPALEKIVTQLDDAGYEFVTVSELLEAKGYDTTKTRVFYSGRQ